ncbi:ROK family transcriptional regulator [Vibrio aerogenes]|nr:ROK family transcriptional regulator [Vibrio aerogenes]
MNQATSEKLKLSANERMLLNIVRCAPGIARSAIAAKTNLTQQSVHRLLEGLIQSDFIVLGELVSQGRGKPSPGICLNPDACFSVGVSLNTDTIQIMLLDFCGTPLTKTSAPFPPADRTQTLNWLKDQLAQWREIYPRIQGKIVGIGLSVPGYFTGKKGFMKPSPPLSDWQETDLLQELETILNYPAWILNNATTGAIGESLFGAGLRHDTFGYLSFNYGFGAGIVIHGEPFFGTFGNAGEIGRIYTREEMPMRPALNELIKRLAQHDIMIHSLSELRQHFSPGWPGVASWVEDVTPYLFRAINTLRGVIDPGAIVLGGELPPALGELLLASVERHDTTRQHDISVRPEIFVSEISNDPCLFGAALFPLRDTFFRH